MQSWARASQGGAAEEVVCRRREGTSEIQRMIIGRAVTGLDVR
jgi:hypothetical protein